MQNIRVGGGATFMPWAKVLTGPQLALPKAIREPFNIKEGDIIDF